MSFVRKNTATHSQLSGAGMSPDFVEALNTLSNSTMKKAYQLLNQPEDGTNSRQELIRLLEQCKKASTVIQSEAPLPNLPVASSLNAPPASRTIPRGIVTKSLLPPPNRRMSGMPRLNNTKRMKMERQKSDSSFKLKDTSEKKSSSSPPPSAVQFLAKLNKSAAVSKKPKLKEARKAAPEPVLPPPAAPEESSEEEEELADDEELEDDEDEEEDEIELEQDDKPVRARRQPSRRESPPKPAGTPPSRRQPGRSSKK